MKVRYDLLDRVTEVLCSFRLVLERKACKAISASLRWEFLEKFLANNFALPGTEDNTSGSLNRGHIADLPLLSTLLAFLQTSPEPSFWEVMHSFFISICKFGSLKKPFVIITSLSELYFRFRRLVLLVQTKAISMSYCSSTSTWKPRRWARFDLIFSMRDIHNNSNLKTLIKFTSTGRSTEFKNILPCNISQLTTKSIPISARIVISYAMKQSIPFWAWRKANGNWDNNMIKISQLRESHFGTNTSVRRKKKIQKKQGSQNHIQGYQ